MLDYPLIEVPIHASASGSLIVKGTQVPLEAIVADYEDGASAEEIVDRHEELRLTDVFLVLSYYLKNRREVEAYLSGRQDAA